MSIRLGKQEQGGGQGIPMGLFNPAAGGGGGVRIDDENISTSTTWSSSKIDTNVSDLTRVVNAMALNVSTMDGQITALQGDMLEVETDVTHLEEKVKEIELFKFPNATIIGEPTIQNGQVSGFSTMSYLQFPFILDLHDQAFQIDFCFTTATNVQTQQNILDSNFGIALAIRDGKGLMAISSDGTSWNIGQSIGTIDIQSNTTYYARLIWNKLQYKTFLSTDGVNYTEDMVLVGATRPFPRTIFIGGCDQLETGHEPHPFLGTINLNKAYTYVNTNLIWQGMDDVGLATRADVSLDNIDEKAVELIKNLAKEAAPSAPIATTTTPGIVKPDGDTVTIDSDGTLHAQGGGGGTSFTPEVPIELKNIQALSPFKNARVDREEGSYIIQRAMFGYNTPSTSYSKVYTDSIHGAGIDFVSAVFYPLSENILYGNQSSFAVSYLGYRNPDNGLFTPYVIFVETSNAMYKVTKVLSTSMSMTTVNGSSRTLSMDQEAATNLPMVMQFTFNPDGSAIINRTQGGASTSTNRLNVYRNTIPAEVMSACNCMAFAYVYSSEGTFTQRSYAATRLAPEGFQVGTITKTSELNALWDEPLYIPEDTEVTGKKLVLNTDSDTLLVNSDNKLSVIPAEDTTPASVTPLRTEVGVTGNTIGYVADSTTKISATGNDTYWNTSYPRLQNAHIVDENAIICDNSVIMPFSFGKVYTLPDISYAFLGTLNDNGNFVPKVIYHGSYLYPISSISAYSTNVVSVTRGSSLTSTNASNRYVMGEYLAMQKINGMVYTYSNTNSAFKSHTADAATLEECTHILAFWLKDKYAHYLGEFACSDALPNVNMQELINGTPNTFKFGDNMTTRSLKLDIDNDTLKVNDQGQLYVDFGPINTALDAINGEEV